MTIDPDYMRVIISHLENGEITDSLAHDIIIACGYDYLREQKYLFNSELLCSVNIAIEFTDTVLPGRIWTIHRDGASLRTKWNRNIWAEGAPAMALVLATLKVLLIEADGMEGRNHGSR